MQRASSLTRCFAKLPSQNYKHTPADSAFTMYSLFTIIPSSATHDALESGFSASEPISNCPLDGFRRRTFVRSRRGRSKTFTPLSPQASSLFLSASAGVVLFPCVRSGRLTALLPVRSGLLAASLPVRSGLLAALLLVRSGLLAASLPVRSGLLAALLLVRSGLLAALLRVRSGLL